MDQYSLKLYQLEAYKYSKKYHSLTGKHGDVEKLNTYHVLFQDIKDKNYKYSGLNVK